MPDSHEGVPKNGREYWNLKALKELMDERHREIQDRFQRERIEQESKVSAALAAQKEQTRDAFQSSEKAIVKAESAQTAHNLLATELQDRLDRQATNFIARPEFDSRIAGIEGKVADLRESRSTDKGRDSGLELAKTNQRWIVGIGITVIFGLITLALKVF